MLVTANRQIARHPSIQNMLIQVWHKIKTLNKWNDRGVVVGIGRQVKKLKVDLEGTARYHTERAQASLSGMPAQRMVQTSST